LEIGPVFEGIVNPPEDLLEKRGEKIEYKKAGQKKGKIEMVTGQL
jgi:hypothetical protein